MKQRWFIWVVLIFTLVLPILACGSDAVHIDNAEKAAASGDLNTAYKEYGDALAGDISPTERVKALLGRAGLYEGEKKYTEALADYDEALAVKDAEGKPAGDVATIYFRRGQVFMTQEDYDKAIVEFDAALKANDKYYEALNRRGYAHLQLRHFDEAIADLKASLQGSVDAAQAKSDLVSAYYDLAFAMLDLGEYEEAIKNFNEAMTYAETTDDKAEILAGRGFTYSEMDDLDAALKDLNEAIAADPNMALAYAYRSYIYSDQEKYEEAIADATKAVEMGTDMDDSRKSSLYHARALAYLNTDRYQEAVADATESIRLEGVDSPEAARTYNIRGRAYRELEDYENAIADATKAIELGSADIVALPGFYYSRAISEYRSGLLDEALADAEAVIELTKNEPSALNYDLLGTIQYELGDYTGAIETYQKAVALDKTDPYLQNSLGDAYYELDDLANAEIAYRAALAIDDKTALFHENLGYVLRMTERYEEAVESYTTALSLDAERPSSYIGRGQAYYALFMDAEARADFEKALTFELSEQTIAFIQEKLGELK